MIEFLEIVTYLFRFTSRLQSDSSTELQENQNEFVIAYVRVQSMVRHPRMNFSILLVLTFVATSGFLCSLALFSQLRRQYPAPLSLQCFCIVCSNDDCNFTYIAIFFFSYWRMQDDYSWMILCSSPAMISKHPINSKPFFMTYGNDQ